MQNDRNLVVYYWLDEIFDITSGAIWASSWGQYHGGTSQWASYATNSVVYEQYENSDATIYVPYSNDWRWNIYGDNYDAGNEEASVTGVVSTYLETGGEIYDGDGVYVDNSGTLAIYGVDANGNAAASNSAEFIIACDSYSGNNGQNCVIAVSGVGCANGVDSANLISLQIGKCARYNWA
ncbi:hypothetical protein HK100_007485 [Physocladia obscura]|uniref:Uncharacterized protein n=1 Tax=Physocladia obscura TaxID=109957 RepID=A0AAD5SRL6_9FUNG|nr:hypothetical protein HK100_007485 [Physocladia obscura]